MPALRVPDAVRIAEQVERLRREVETAGMSIECADTIIEAHSVGNDARSSSSRVGLQNLFDTEERPIDAEEAQEVVIAPNAGFEGSLQDVIVDAVHVGA